MKILFMCIAVICRSQGVFSKGCSLPIDIFDDEHMPVLVDNRTSSFKLILPNEGRVDLKQNEKITLICPSHKNTLQLTHTNSTLASCVKDETLRIINFNTEVQKVTCTKGVRGDARSTNMKCGGGQGYIIQIGFPVDESHFLTLIEVCYDSANGNALYAIHTLVGQEIDYASKSNYRPGFSTAELGPGVSANVAYKQTYQKATFSKLLGSATLATSFINKKSFLARGHLAADADFLFASWQFATFFYVNTVPQWQTVNNGNWKSLEMMSRGCASAYAEDLRVYTGVHKILELPDTRNKNTKIYLVTSGSKLAVPKFVWKILYSERSGQAIAFVSVNNPFKTKMSTSDKLCTNVCNRYGWDRPQWNNGSKGFIYCCDARDLLGVVPTGPKIKVSGILRAPEISARFNLFDDSM